MIRLVGVHKSFGGPPVLHGVDLEVPAAGVTFLVGRSGVGKSVLSRCCVGLLRVDSGEVHVSGERVDRWPDRKLNELRRRVPSVVQGSALLDWMSLRENVALALERGRAVCAAEARERADKALAQMELAPLSGRTPPEVGPGARKQASIARALALEPMAVLYDEPTPGLDAGEARRGDRLSRQSANRGTAALVVSHDLSSIEGIADRVAVLDEGVIAFLGSAQDFFRARDEVPAVRRFFFQGEEQGCRLPSTSTPPRRTR